MQKRPSSSGKFRKQPRNHRVTVMLNDSELRTITKYCERYKMSNRSNMIRQTLMRAILKRFDKDSPTLFD